MKFSKMIYTVFFYSLLSTTFVGSAIAAEPCVQCENKKVQGLPSIDSKLVSVVGSMAKPPPEANGISFESYQDGFCRKYSQILINQLPRLISDLEETTSYSIDNYLQKPGCVQEGYGGNVKSPMLHLSADDPTRHDEFLQLFYKYYTIKRKDPSLWLAAVNAKNTKGETLLDYFEHQEQNTNFNSAATKKSVASIIAFACSKGAVYSKYSNKSCP